jgi:hypothetical protein
MNDLENDDSRFHIGTVAPRVRWSPLRNSDRRVTDLTLQHYVSFPVYRSNENLSSKPTYGSQIIVTSRLGYNVILQGQFDIVVPPKVEAIESRPDLIPMDDKQPIITPISGFLSYAFSTRFMLFALLQYIPEYGSVQWATSDAYYRRRYSTNAGLGIQLGFSRRVSANLYFSRVLDDTYGYGLNSINLGVRVF